MRHSISIVTICFNNLDDLKRTCTSVDGQQEKPFEHYIIDGSTQHDIKHWLENTPQPYYRRWINERDKGIADAFNKGVRLSSGSIIYLLNSGDTLYDETVLSRVKDIFRQNEGLMWCHGKLKLMRGGEWVIVGKPFEKEKLYRGMRSVFHPTMHIKREVYERRGVYDVNVKIAMDYDFLCRLADEPFAFVDYPLAVFDPTGVSSSKYLEGVRESFRCYQKYFGFSFKQKVWYVRLAFLHKLLQSGLGKWLYRLKVKMGGENV
jgi:glycosyltransferase involved in cell wall biosynthesis